MRTNMQTDAPTLNGWIAACVPVEVDEAPVRTVGPLRTAVLPTGTLIVIGRVRR